MYRFLLVFLLGLSLVQSACSPTFNWRELRLDQGALATTFPCKPDQIERPVDLGGRQVQMFMQGCEAGRLLFAVAVMDTASEGSAATGKAAWAPWKQANLLAMKAGQVQSLDATVAGADSQAGERVTAVGEKPGGEAVESQALYFSRNHKLFYAVILGHPIPAEVAEVFFTGLKTL